MPYTLTPNSLCFGPFYGLGLREAGCMTALCAPGIYSIISWVTVKELLLNCYNKEPHYFLYTKNGA